MELHQACKDGDQLVVDDLISKVSDIDTAAPVTSVFEGKTPLQLAAESGHTSIVQSLLAAGADPVRISPSKASALHLAAIRGQTAVIQQLLDAGSDVNTGDLQGSTPLIWAASSGELAAVQLLLAAGASVDTIDRISWTALHNAAFHGHPQVIEELLAAGADASRLTDHGATPFEKAVDNDQLAAVKVIVQDASVTQAVLVRALQKAADSSNVSIPVLDFLLTESVRRDRDAVVKILENCDPAYSSIQGFVQGWLSGMAASDATSDQVRQAIAREKKELEDERRNIQQLIVQLAAMQRHQQATNGTLQENSDSC